MTTNKSDQVNHFDLLVVGGGLAGLTSALALAICAGGQERTIGLVAPVAEKPDMRTTAMMMPTIDTMKSIGAWDNIEPHTAALKTMRLIDGTDRLIRSPVIDFKSSEIDIEAFGYNVPNWLMTKKLNEMIDHHSGIERIHSKVEQAECLGTHVTVKLENGDEITTDLAVAADGRHSMLRSAADIETKSWSYPQTAIVLTFGHSLPHGGVSAEFHTSTGPFTQVPLPPSKHFKHRSSLVWVVHPNQVDEIVHKSLDELSFQIEEKLQSCFGKVSVEEAPKSFPLSGMTARKFAAQRVVLVGEAGHVFPPIGAQGFNLGVRDLNELIRLVDKKPAQLGDTAFTNTYNRNRTTDVHLRTAGVDILNRSLLTGFLPVQLARVVGVTTLKNINWIKKLAMHEGLGAGARQSIFDKLFQRLPNRMGKDRQATNL